MKQKESSINGSMSLARLTLINKMDTPPVRLAKITGARNEMPENPRHLQSQKLKAWVKCSILQNTSISLKRR